MQNDAGLAKGILWWRTGGFVWSRLYFGRLPIEEILSRMRMNEAWGLHQTISNIITCDDVFEKILAG